MPVTRFRIFTTAIVTLTAACGGAALLSPTAYAFVQTTPTTTVATTPTTTTTTPGTTTTTPTPGSVDTASDLAALTAYKTYLQSLVDGATTARAQVQTFVTTTASTCQGALTPVTAMDKTDVSSAALTALGQEIGSDLWLSFSAAAEDPFSVLSSTLSTLHWTHRTTAQAVTAFVAAESDVMAMEPSSLCKDALLLAAKPTAVPTSARTFLKSYQTARATLKLKLASFLSVLELYQTPSEAKLVASIDKLAAQFDAVSLSAQHSSATTLLSDLGI